MVTNKLLEKKYRAQEKLVDRSKKKNKEYLEIIEEEVKRLYGEKGWQSKLSPRTGGYLKDLVKHAEARME